MRTTTIPTDGVCVLKAGRFYVYSGKPKLKTMHFQAIGLRVTREPIFKNPKEGERVKPSLAYNASFGKHNKIPYAGLITFDWQYRISSKLEYLALDKYAVNYQEFSDADAVLIEFVTQSHRKFQLEYEDRKIKKHLPNYVHLLTLSKIQDVAQSLKDLILKSG